jgi:hypothetical protein
MVLSYLLRTIDASGGQGVLLKNHPLDPRKTFVYIEQNYGAKTCKKNML